MTVEEIRKALAEFESVLIRTRGERDYYQRMCVRLSELVERQGLNVAEKHLLESVDQFAENLPTG